MRFRRLEAGDPAPWVTMRTPSLASLRIDSAAGKYIVLCFLLSSGSRHGVAALKAIATHRKLFDDERASLFAITIDRADEARMKDGVGVRFALDMDSEMSRLYGSVSHDDGEGVGYRPLWIVLDPMMRIMRVAPMEGDLGSVAEDVMHYVAALPPPSRASGIETPAPVLILPGIFEPDFCRHLIAIYQATGGKPSGFMDEADGKTFERKDAGFKTRRDVHLADESLQRDIQRRFKKRVIPEISRIHYFEATRMERYLVACYDADERGHFHPHRDNTTKATAHRRFAVSINLNDDFEGGEIYFPEFGAQAYKPPTGCAVVFSCSLLHGVRDVTRGRRFAFLPFLYDEAAAVIREQNKAFLEIPGEDA